MTNISQVSCIGSTEVQFETNLIRPELGVMYQDEVTLTIAVQSPIQVRLTRQVIEGVRYRRVMYRKNIPVTNIKIKVR
jgi:hypothetical protein